MKATSTGTQVVEEYKKSKDFKDEVIEAAYDAFKLDFVECKKKVIKAFLELIWPAPQPSCPNNGGRRRGRR